jgi:hypothetical protein
VVSHPAKSRSTRPPALVRMRRRTPGVYDANETIERVRGGYRATKALNVSGDFESAEAPTLRTQRRGSPIGDTSALCLHAGAMVAQAAESLPRCADN